MRDVASLGLLALVSVAGCGGSLRPAVLLESARAAYPDCDEVAIAERADGVRQWMIICGERRLFGLRAEADVARDRASRGLAEDEPFDAVLADQSPPIAWGAAQRVDEASVVAWLRPLRVELTMLGVGDGSWYFTVEAPERASCEADPQIFVGGERRTLGSAPTASEHGARARFAQRLDLATLRLLASEPFEISHCGERHRLDPQAAEVFRAWASERAAAAAR